MASFNSFDDIKPFSYFLQIAAIPTAKYISFWHFKRDVTSLKLKTLILSPFIKPLPTYMGGFLYYKHIKIKFNKNYIKLAWGDKWTCTDLIRFFLYPILSGFQLNTLFFNLVLIQQSRPIIEYG